MVWSRMWQRILTAVVAGGGFLAVLSLGGNAYLTLLAAIAGIAYGEYCEMRRISWFRVESVVGLLYVWFLFFLLAVPKPFAAISPFTVTIVFLFVWMLWTVISRNRVTVDTVGYLFVGALYIGAGFAFMAATRFVQDGLWVSLFVIAVTWVTDSGAYLVGKRWGKHKLWPAISPKKTVEGSIAGVVFASLTGILFGTLFKGSLFSLPDAFLLAVLISVLGQLGDLIESALKRANNVKDSGHLLPGHGGMLDRFDSLLFTFMCLHIFQLIG